MVKRLKLVSVLVNEEVDVTFHIELQLCTDVELLHLALIVTEAFDVLAIVLGGENDEWEVVLELVVLMLLECFLVPMDQLLIANELLE